MVVQRVESLALLMVPMMAVQWAGMKADAKVARLVVTTDNHLVVQMVALWVEPWVELLVELMVLTMAVQ